MVVLKRNNLKLKSKINYKKIFTKNPPKKQVFDILKIKKKEWKYGLKSQQNFFSKNYHSDDVHNLIYIKNNLVAYNCLKFIKNKNKKIIIFDSLVVDKKYRNLGISKIIMLKSIKEISKHNKNAYLYTDKTLLKYYREFGWIKINKNKLDIKKKNKNLLKFNEKYKFD